MTQAPRRLGGLAIAYAATQVEPCKCWSVDGNKWQNLLIDIKSAQYTAAIETQRGLKWPRGKCNGIRTTVEVGSLRSSHRARTAGGRPYHQQPAGGLRESVGVGRIAAGSRPRGGGLHRGVRSRHQSTEGRLPRQ